MQFPGQAPVLGVIYTTTMSRPDSALALALLYGLQAKREARVAAIAVSGAGLGTAAFCDAVGRFYSPGPVANSNRTLPVGLFADGTLPPDSPMVKAVMAHEPPYAHSIERLSDTSELPALMRNALTAQADGKAAFLLSSPATHLAKVLNLLGTRDLIVAKVKLLVICDSGDKQDAAALRQILTDWPTPIVYFGPEIGVAVPYPATSIEKDFSWSTAHPVIDAYRACHPMPYDAPTWDMAAALYAVRPDAGLFPLSAGSIQVSDAGALSFSPSPTGKHHALAFDPAQKEKVTQAYIELASAKPLPPRQGRGK